VEFTFWDEQWREHTEQSGEQGRKTSCSTDSSPNDNASEKGQNQIHSQTKT
jgi:hypothetical protein